ncbi:MAG TPA: hypothetical protein VFZ65_11770 [Planctomycetota bacterium]|nr:hypothetical protein [Planctomycetota bacterium]
MIARFAPAVPSLLLCTALVSQGVEPTLAEPLTSANMLMPPGSLNANDLAFQWTTPTQAFVGMTRQTSSTSPYSAVAYDYDLSSLSVTLRSDFASLAPGVQELSITPDLRTIAVFRNGVGPGVQHRASVGAAWSAQQSIAGLAGGSYGLEFCRIDGVLSMAACEGLPNPRITLYDFDQTTLSVSNARSLVPTFAANTYPAFLMPLADDHGEARGLCACIRGLVGFTQQFVYCEGVDPTSRWSVLYNSTNAFFVGGGQLVGGHMVVANAGPPIGSTPQGLVELVAALTFETRISTAGGLTNFAAMGRKGDIGVVGIALDRISPVPVPGFQNLFGLNPGTLFFLCAFAMPMGVGHYDFQMPPTPVDCWPIQSASLSLAGAANVFGNTSRLEVIL